MNGLWEKRGQACYPVDERAWNFFHRLKAGTRWVMDSKDPTRRSGEQHRFWFALLGHLFDGQEYYTDKEVFRSCLLIRLGYCTRHKMKGGEKIPVAKSLKFGKMPADEFGALVDATLDFAVDMGWSREELLSQTREMAGVSADALRQKAGKAA